MSHDDIGAALRTQEIDDITAAELAAIKDMEEQDINAAIEYAKQQRLMHELDEQERREKELDNDLSR